MDKDAAVIIIGRFFQALLGVAALRIMTAVLSPAQAGSMFLILSFVTGFAFFFINPVGMYINRRLHAWQAGGIIMPHFSGFNIYVFLISAAAVPITLVVKKISGAGSDLPGLSFALTVSAYLYFNTWNMTLVPALNMLGYRIPFVVFSVLTIGIGLLLSLLVSIKISATAFSWLSGQIIAMFLISLAAACSLCKNTKENFSGFIKFQLGSINKEAVRDVAAFALPLAGATLFMWLQNQGYRLIVEMKAGAEFLGYLAVGLGIAASLAAVAESLVQQIYFPAFYKQISSGGPEERKNALAELSEKTLPVYVILLFFTVSLASQLTGLIVAPKFRDAAKFVAFGALIEFFRMAANIISSAAHAEMRTKMLIKPYVAGGLITCGGVYAASLSLFKENLIPLAMVFGGVATLLVMRWETAHAIRFALNRKLLIRTGVYSLPLCFFLFLRKFNSPALSFTLLAVAGLYFIFLQYWVVFRWTKAAAVGGGWKNMESHAALRPGEGALL